MDVLVSVIIPVYNAEQYIADCLMSVLRQSLRQIEVVCIDDGSTDNSIGVISELSLQDDRMRLLRQEHGGAGRARNLGISHATGKYLAFLDADDMYGDANALEQMVKACEENDCHICGSQFVDDLYDDQKSRRNIFEDIQLPRKGRKVLFEEYQNDFNYTAFIVSKNLVLENKLQFPEYRRYQDPVFFLRTLVAAKSFYGLPISLYIYRHGHQSNTLVKHSYDIFRAISENMDIAIENNYRKLYERLMERVIDWYVIYMEEDCLPEDSLDCFVSILHKGAEFERTTCVYKRIISRIREMRIYREEENCLYRNIIMGQRNGFFARYFREKGIREVVIYGLGQYGKILTDVLDRADVSIAAYVDKKLNDFEGHKVNHTFEDISKNSTIIISLRNPEIVRREIEKLGYRNIICFRDIIDSVTW